MAFSALFDQLVYDRLINRRERLSTQGSSLVNIKGFHFGYPFSSLPNDQGCFWRPRIYVQSFHGINPWAAWFASYRR
jgi:hypothetical protein